MSQGSQQGSVGWEQVPEQGAHERDGMEGVWLGRVSASGDSAPPGCRWQVKPLAGGIQVQANDVGALRGGEG